MFWVNIKRVFRTGFVNFWRNGFVSLSSVLVMITTLFVISSVIFVGASLRTSLQILREKVDINVYFVTNAKEDDILALKKILEGTPEVSEVAYISREQALQNFQERHADDQLTIQALQELGENPLGAVLNIKARDPGQYEQIAAFLKTDNVISRTGSNIIDSINYNRNKVAIEKLSTIIDMSERAGLVVTIILICITVIITFNTIRLSIFTSRDEISVMRLVGARNSYIRGPFVVNGILYGLISGVVTLIMLYPICFSLRHVSKNFTGLDIFQFYIHNLHYIFLIVVGFGVVIGAISSYLAVRRYLKI